MRLTRRGIVFVASLVVLAGLVAISMDRPGRGPGPGGQPTVVPSTRPSSGQPTPSSAGEPSTSTAPIATPGSPPGADVSGSWSGTWTSETRSDAQGGIAVAWGQEGTALDGSITMDGQVCLNGNIARGTLNGLDIEFRAVQREAPIDFVGTVSGNSMSGTFSTECDIGQGTWTMQKGS